MLVSILYLLLQVNSLRQVDYQASQRQSKVLFFFEGLSPYKKGVARVATVYGLVEDDGHFSITKPIFSAKGYMGFTDKRGFFYTDDFVPEIGSQPVTSISPQNVCVFEGKSRSIFNLKSQYLYDRKRDLLYLFDNQDEIERYRWNGTGWTRNRIYNFPEPHCRPYDWYLSRDGTFIYGVITTNNSQSTFIYRLKQTKAQRPMLTTEYRDIPYQSGLNPNEFYEGNQIIRYDPANSRLYVAGKSGIKYRPPPTTSFQAGMFYYPNPLQLFYPGGKLQVLDEFNNPCWGLPADNNRIPDLDSPDLGDSIFYLGKEVSKGKLVYYELFDSRKLLGKYGKVSFVTYNAPAQVILLSSDDETYRYWVIHKTPKEWRVVYSIDYGPY